MQKGITLILVLILAIFVAALFYKLTAQEKEKDNGLVMPDFVNYHNHPVNRHYIKREVLSYPSSGLAALLRADWNADGTDEILLVEGSGPYTVKILLGNLSTLELFTFNEQIDSFLTAADMNGDKLPELCTGGHWGCDPVILSHEGREMLHYAPIDGTPDSAVISDLGRNGYGMLIVGYNGGDGLRVTDIAGNLLFKDKIDLGNVWTVRSCDLDGDGVLEFVNSSSTGALEVWSNTFMHMRTMAKSVDVWTFGVTDYNGDGTSEILAKAGYLLDGSGNVLYEGDKTQDFLSPQLMASADVCKYKGIETAWSDHVPGRMLEIRGQNWKVLYRQDLGGQVFGLVSTAGIPGWKPGFLVIVNSDQLLLFTGK
jgi:hypothetical protein